MTTPRILDGLAAVLRNSDRPLQVAGTLRVVVDYDQRLMDLERRMYTLQEETRLLQEQAAVRRQRAARRAT